MKSILILACLVSVIASAAPALEPSDSIDYSKLAFYPKRWEEQGFDTTLVPWKGEQVAFLTVSKDHDPEVMGKFVDHLDAGWQLYRELTGQKPRPHRLVDGRAPIAALLGNGLSCGYGCGYVGATGIEMTHFYDGHYPALKKDPNDVPHAYFYEMGRNYFTFGNRHDCFTTGFAVFMRYVCVDTLGLVDRDKGTRKIIDKAIEEYAQTDLPFLRAFTNADGLSEKQNRLKSSPTDQPVMYASAMLHLWKKLGDDWLKAFYRQLATVEGSSSRTKEGAQKQCIAWYLAASCAAKKDLAPIFIDTWRLKIPEEARTLLAKTIWNADELEAGSLLKAFFQGD